MDPREVRPEQLCRDMENLAITRHVRVLPPKPFAPITTTTTPVPAEPYRSEPLPSPCAIPFLIRQEVVGLATGLFLTALLRPALTSHPARCVLLMCVLLLAAVAMSAVLLAMLARSRSFEVTEPPTPDEGFSLQRSIGLYQCIGLLAAIGFGYWVLWRGSPAVQLHFNPFQRFAAAVLPMLALVFCFGAPGDPQTKQDFESLYSHAFADWMKRYWRPWFLAGLLACFYAALCLPFVAGLVDPELLDGIFNAPNPAWHSWLPIAFLCAVGLVIASPAFIVRRSFYLFVAPSLRWMYLQREKERKRTWDEDDLRRRTDKEYDDKVKRLMAEDRQRLDYEAQQRNYEKDVKAAEDWKACVDKMMSSDNVKERRHLFLGVHAEQGYPVILDRNILAEHAYLVGDSGSGKTALGIMPLVYQLIRQDDGVRTEADGSTSAIPHGGMVILDLKGDMALFQMAQEQAREQRRTFKFFTIERGCATFAYNPFEKDDDTTTIGLYEKCERVLEALNLNHGEGYGRSYYSRVARKWLLSTLQANKNIASFADLQTAVEKASFEAQEKRDAFELISVIQILSRIEQLNVTEETNPDAYAQRIRMKEVIEKRQVVYFWLPSARLAATAREIAKLALYDLLTRANDLKGKHQVYLVIDEFQRIASEGFKIILQQARSMGIGAILANQTLADLLTHDTDLRATVYTNTRFKQYFSVSDVDSQNLAITTSGEMKEVQVRRGFAESKSTTAQESSGTGAGTSSADSIGKATGWTGGGAVNTTTQAHISGSMRTSFQQSGTGKQQGETTSVQNMEVVVPRFTRNDIIEISNDPLRSIVHIPRGAGFSDFQGYPIPLRLYYPMQEAYYNDIKSRDWPEQQAFPGTFVARSAPREPFSFPVVAGGVIDDE